MPSSDYSRNWARRLGTKALSECMEIATESGVNPFLACSFYFGVREARPRIIVARGRRGRSLSQTVGFDGLFIECKTRRSLLNWSTPNSGVAMAIDGGGRVRPCDGEIVEFLQQGGGAYEEVFTALCPRRPPALVAYKLIYVRGC